MAGKHFYESLERENDYQLEYKKLEAICAEKYSPSGFGYDSVSINSWIERYFRKWKKRSNFCSFAELRKHLGFVSNYSEMEYSFPYEDISLQKYILFSEMILNLINELRFYRNPTLDSVVEDFENTVKATIAKAGMEIKRVNNEIMIVEQDAVSIHVADMVPALADVVIEYNHYLIRGNIERKKYLLKQLADSLEPKKKDLLSINKTVTNDFFFLVNSMNIRHNNCDPSDESKYNPKLTKMKKSEIEKWYDITYDQGLALFVLLEQQERNQLIAGLK